MFWWYICPNWTGWTFSVFARYRYRYLSVCTEDEMRIIVIIVIGELNGINDQLLWSIVCIFSNVL